MSPRSSAPRTPASMREKSYAGSAGSRGFAGRDEPTTLRQTTSIRTRSAFASAVRSSQRSRTDAVGDWASGTAIPVVIPRSAPASAGAQNATAVATANAVEGKPRGDPAASDHGTHAGAVLVRRRRRTTATMIAARSRAPRMIGRTIPMPPDPESSTAELWVCGRAGSVRLSRVVPLFSFSCFRDSASLEPPPAPESSVSAVLLVGLPAAVPCASADPPPPEGADPSEGSVGAVSAPPPDPPPPPPDPPPPPPEPPPPPPEPPPPPPEPPPPPPEPPPPPPEPPPPPPDPPPPPPDPPPPPPDPPPPSSGWWWSGDSRGTGRSRSPAPARWTRPPPRVPRSALRATV